MGFLAIFQCMHAFYNVKSGSTLLFPQHLSFLDGENVRKTLLFQLLEVQRVIICSHLLCTAFQSSLLLLQFSPHLCTPLPLSQASSSFHEIILFQILHMGGSGGRRLTHLNLGSYKFLKICSHQTKPQPHEEPCFLTFLLF